MKLRRILFITYVILALVLFGYVFFTVEKVDDRDGEMISFGEDWRTGDGRLVDLSTLSFENAGEEIVLTHATPDSARMDDVWNLVSHNIYFSVEVNGLPVYEFHPGENITGKG